MKELKEYKILIDEYLEQYLSTKVLEYSKISPEITKFVEILKEFTLRGGKRLRPALLYYTYRLFSDENLEEIIRLSAFLELTQSFLLIHDDIMDNAKLRRGEDTVHTIYHKYFNEKGYTDSEELAKSMAILCGDLAQQFQIDIINKVDIEADKKNRAISLLTEYLNTVIFGQIHDLILPHEDKFIEKDILLIHDLKTSTYTCKLPMEIGAILAGANKKEIKHLLGYAKPLGIAFQIKDDILGVFESDIKTGKDFASDLIEGKKTLLLLKAIEDGSNEDREYIEKHIKDEGINVEQIQKIQEIFRRTGALQYSEGKCVGLIQEAKQSLLYFEDEKYDQESVEFLMGVADYVSSAGKY